MAGPESDKTGKGSRTLAYGVHVLTALGAALGFLALRAVFIGDLAQAFIWLGAALMVDAVDGPLARRLKVKEQARRYDGAQLDLVVDFVTYVFVPAAMLLRPEVMTQPYGVIAGLVVTLASALYFADTGMKTDDWWFRGFPAVWNIVVFYIVAFAPPAWLVTAARDTGTMTAELRLVPNQPVVFEDDPTRKPRTEDDFIAYTWDKYLRTGDARWLPQLPMTRAVVSAMDAISDYMATQPGGGVGI